MFPRTVVKNVRFGSGEVVMCEEKMFTDYKFGAKGRLTEKKKMLEEKFVSTSGAILEEQVIKLASTQTRTCLDSNNFTYIKGICCCG